MKEKLKTITNYLIDRPSIFAIVFMAIGLIAFFLQMPKKAKDKLDDAQIKLYEAQASARASQFQADCLRSALERTTLKLQEAQQIIKVTQQINQQLEASYYKNKKSDPIQIDSLKNYLKAIQKLQRRI